MVQFPGSTIAYGCAVSQSLEWRQKTCQFAADLLTCLGADSVNRNSMYTHHIDDLDHRKSYPVVDDMLTFDGTFWSFGLGFEIETPECRTRISIKLRTDFREGRLFVGVADEEEFFNCPDDSKELYDHIRDRIVSHLKTARNLATGINSIPIAY